MNILLRQRALEALAEAPPSVQKAFIKQMIFLARDLRHPGLHAKKYNEAEDKWQGRITDDWRFYFKIEAGATESGSASDVRGPDSFDAVPGYWPSSISAWRLCQSAAGVVLSNPLSIAAAISFDSNGPSEGALNEKR
jgi:hypothetical protein